MGQFLYFLRDAADGSVNRKSLLDSPLAVPLRDLLRSDRVFRDRVVVNHWPMNGPGGFSGVMVNVGVTDAEDTQQPCVSAEHQRWEPIGETGWQIGIDFRYRPTEVDLRRESIVPGYERVLGDGAGWTCPTIRKVDKERGSFTPQLPMRWVWRNGHRTASVCDEYQGLWMEACEVFDYVVGRESKAPGQLADFAENCLSLNYRVGTAEIHMLELLSFDQADEVWRAAVDVPLIEDWMEEVEKKRDAPPPE